LWRERKHIQGQIQRLLKNYAVCTRVARIKAQLEKKEFIDIIWRKEGAVCMPSKGKGKNKT
jgi:hypothetical protein